MTDTHGTSMSKELITEEKCAEIRTFYNERGWLTAYIADRFEVTPQTVRRHANGCCQHGPLNDRD